MARTQQQINDIGFRALVDALGKDDALRFVRYMGATMVEVNGKEKKVEDAEYLPPMTVEEVHRTIMDMHGPSDQASFL
ncbi:MAG: hypothetical protein JWQ98_2422 [Chlorobi bacterium]|nr:hypothetical protein [Chlorobiota bacterium]